MKNIILTTPNSQLSTKTAIILALTIACLILPQAAQAATYYLDANNGNDITGNGDSSLPWKTFSKTQSVVAAGDTVYLTGDFGSIAFTSSSPAGTADSWITYQAWPGKAQPTFGYISFAGTNKNVYLKFDGLRIDPGYVSVSKGAGGVVNLGYVNYVDFENCNLEGEKIAGLSGDFAPYAFPTGPIISGGNSPQMSSYITINHCTFKYGWRQLFIVQHPNYPERPVQYWTITNNDFSEWSEDAITTSGSGYLAMSNNYLHNGHNRRGYYSWPGTATGTWSDKLGQTVTQDTTGASGVFYQISVQNDGRFYIYSDDLNHLPSTLTSAIWRLDSDPANIYFTPSGTGDFCHTDGFAIQAASHDITIQNNTFRGNGLYSVQNKIEPAATNITLTNNLFFTDTYGNAFMLLLAGINNTLNNNTFVYANGYLSSAIRIIDSTAGANVPAGQNLYIYNNILSGITWSSGETVHSDNNIWGSQPPSQINEGSNSRVITNLTGVFVNRSADDFNLAATSSAINFGNSTYSLTTDILGNSRDSQPDAGCYEYGASSSSITGDINSDGSVDALDLQLLINIILSGSFDSKADLNKDSSVDAIDLQALVNIILGA